MKFSRVLILSFIALTTITFSQNSSIEYGLGTISEQAVRGQLEYLASDWFEGRETGTKGCDMAADYIASMFKVYGLKPAGDVETIYPSFREMRNGAKATTVESYFQTFSLMDYKPGDQQFLSVISNENGVSKKMNFNYRTDFSMRTSSVAIEIESPVVFVGYGYKNEKEGYDDFEDVNVKGKVILRISGYPGHLDTASAAYKKFKYEGRWGRWSLARDKNKWAEANGAIAVIEVDLQDNPSLDWAVNKQYRYDTDIYEGTEELSSGIRNRMLAPGDSVSATLTSISVTPRLAHELITGTGINFKNFEEYSKVKMKPSSKELKSKKVYVKTSVVSEIFKVRNVLAKIDGENPDEIIVIGGHYDHVGINKGYIWNGSDDNASGTVGMMTLARAFKESGVKPNKTIIFAAWTGEEEGLLGSEYFVNNYKYRDNVILNLNYDMISRDSDEDSAGVGCELVFTNTYPQFQELAEKYNDELGLGLKIELSGSKQPGGGSDHAPFAEKGIPVFYLMAGWPKEYHQPGDIAKLANIHKMTNIIKLGYRMVSDFATMLGKLTKE